MGQQARLLPTPEELVDIAIMRIKSYRPAAGFWLAFSGGKDSVVLHDLTERAGVRFDAHYCVSPIDPKEVREFIVQQYPKVRWDYYARGFWGKPLMSNGPPMRQFRWCCRLIKEAGGDGRRKLTGIRWAEGRANRRGRLMYEPCYNKPGTDFLHPIIDWTDDDVWNYIQARGLSVCSLYAEGAHRIGCVLCPFHRNVDEEMARHPDITRLWRRGCDRYFDKRIERGTPLQWPTKEAFWYWWIYERG
jgi:phosphoadenosine phosphosulfate reductase